jgi:hypothetical protein
MSTAPPPQPPPRSAHGQVELTLTLELDPDSPTALLRTPVLPHRRRCRVTEAEYRSRIDGSDYLDLRVHAPPARAHCVPLHVIGRPVRDRAGSRGAQLPSSGSHQPVRLRPLDPSSPASTNQRARRPLRRAAPWVLLWAAGQLKQQSRRRRWCGDRAAAMLVSADCSVDQQHELSAHVTRLPYSLCLCDVRQQECLSDRERELPGLDQVSDLS